MGERCNRSGLGVAGRIAGVEAQGALLVGGWAEIGGSGAAAVAGMTGLAHSSSSLPGLRCFPRYPLPEEIGAYGTRGKLGDGKMMGMDASEEMHESR